MTNNDTTQVKRQNIFIIIWQFLTEPHPDVIEIAERRRAQLLSGLTLILVIFFIWAVLSNPSGLTPFVIFFGITLFAYATSRSKYYRIGTYLFSFGFTSIAYINIYNGSANSVESSIASIVPISLIIASAILTQRGYIALLIATAIATGTVTSYADPKFLEELISSFGRIIGVTIATGGILFGITLFRTRLERARLNEIQETNKKLENLTANLEERVNERTNELDQVNQQVSSRAAQLQAITLLSESIAQFQDLRQLLPSTTTLINAQFGFYHIGIFLLDNETEFAVLQAANSEGGKRMLERGHRLKLGSGVVGFAAQTGNPRIALDVGSDAVFFDNPDLPDTRSEAALPLIIRGSVIGVLDVQSTEANAFSTEDLQVLTALANQVAIAIENARLLTETRAALKRAQDIYEEFTRTEWGRTVSESEQPGFRFNAGRIEMVEKEFSSPEIVSAVKSGLVSKGPPEGDERERSTIAVPVKLRGEVIGVLHIESEDASRVWNEEDISLVEAVAERAAFAMENARLFQDARRRAAKERLISEASAKISGALNIENILQTTAEELERVLGGADVLIQFQNKEAE